MSKDKQLVWIYYREEVNDYLHEIYFLPDHPELKDIHGVLQDYKKVGTCAIKKLN